MREFFLSRGLCLAAGIALLAAPRAAPAEPPSLSQAQELAPFDAPATASFGFAVGISGNVAVIGAQSDLVIAGSAYVYRFAGGTWSEEQKLTASDGALGDQFGYSVGVAGDVAVIGARNAGGSGAAYVFRYDGSDWVEEKKLVASDAAAGDQFGLSVAVSGGVVLVGAQRDDDDGNNSGAAYVYRYAGGTWVEDQKLRASDAAAEALFGSAVTLSGGLAVIGAEGDASFAGAAYVFHYDGVDWVEDQKLQASDATAGDAFGNSVALAGDVVVVGAPLDGDAGDSSGSAYVYRYAGSTWGEDQKLVASDAAAGDQLGHSVAVLGNVAVIGADAAGGSGAAYVYRFGGVDWAEQLKLLATDAAAGDGLGRAVAASGRLALVGAPAASGSGRAYVFSLAQPIPALGPTWLGVLGIALAAAGLHAGAVLRRRR